MCLFLGGGGLLFCLFVLFDLQRRHGPAPDSITQIAAIAFGPITGLAAWLLSYHFDASSIVEFACDESSFRFRTLGGTGPETRSLAEVAKVWDRSGRQGVSAYRVVFKDGGEAVISINGLPNAKALAERLRSHMQAA
ncbi:MAG: hypothetical protein ABSC93_08960 [Bryobacteraceae bacterium]